MVGQMNEPIVIDTVLTKDEFEGLWQYFDRTSPAVSSLATWTLNNASYGKGDPVSWQHPLRTDLMFTKCATTIRLKMMKHLRRDIRLCKIHANGQTAGQNTLFHKDYPLDDVWTFIFFNQKEWSLEWGGEFVSQRPDGKTFYTPYIPNTGVFIPSNWDHKGHSPNTLIGNGYRTTVAFSFCIPEIHDHINEKQSRRWY